MEDGFHEAYQPRYQRSLNHNYLVLRGGGEEDYQLRMIQENRIPCLLPLTSRSCEGREELYYEISSLQPIARLYEHKEMGWEEVRLLTERLLDAYELLQGYLLDDKHIVLEPEQIYMDLEDQSISLLFHPAYERAREESLLRLAEYYLDRINHRDNRAAMFAYQLYKLVRRDNFVTGDIRQLLEETEHGGGESRRSEAGAEPAVPRGELVGAGSGAREEGIRWSERLPRVSQRGKSEAGAEREAEAEPARRGVGWSERLTRVSQRGKGEAGAEPPMRRGESAGAEWEAEPAEEREAVAAGRARGKGLLVLSALLLLAALALYTGVFRGGRTGGAEKLTAAALLAVSAVGLVLWRRGGRKRETAEAEGDTWSEDFFADLEPGSAAADRAGQRDIAERGGRGDITEPLPRQVAAEPWQEESETEQREPETYGKTVFLEPEKEELQNILKEKGKAKEYPMSSFPYTIGKVRDCVDLALSDRSVSRIHARILREDGRLYLQDCRSTNGTYLNGMQLEAEEKVLLEKEDEIGIGRLRFVLV